MQVKLKSRIFLIASIVLLAAAAGGYFRRSSERRQIARNAATLVPDLQGAHPELVERVQVARAQIQLGGQPVEALATLTRLYYANGWFAPAARTCAGLVELEPHNPQWSYLLAIMRANSGQLHEALPLLQQTIRRAPDYLPARLKIAAVLTKQNQADAAIAMEKIVLEKEPANIYAWVGLGNIYVAQKKWDLARESFQKALSFSDQFRSAWLGLVSVCEATGDNNAAAEAQSHVDTVSRSPDSPDPWIDTLLEECYNVYYLRVAASSIPDMIFAQRLLDRAARLQPKDAAVHRDFGMLLLRLRAYGEARHHLELATSLAPADSDNWIGLITLLRAIRDEAGIGQAIRSGLAQCPSSAGLWLERGRMLRRTHAFDEALAAFAKSEELGAEDAAPHVETAVVYFQMEQMEPALRELKAALGLQPNHPFAQVLMARYAIMAGDKTTASFYFEKVRRNPSVLIEDKKQLLEAFESAFGAGSR